MRLVQPHLELPAVRVLHAAASKTLVAALGAVYYDSMVCTTRMLIFQNSPNGKALISSFLIGESAHFCRCQMRLAFLLSSLM